MGEITKRALQKKKALGERVGSIPHGFKCLNGMLILDEFEQETIEIVRKLKLCDFSLRQTGFALKTMGRLNREGRMYVSQSVGRMLKITKDNQRG